MILNLRYSSFAAATLFLPLLASCAGSAEPNPGSTGGVAGAGGLASGGQSTAGVGGGGASGSGGLGGQSTGGAGGGTGGGGLGGQSTGGVGGGGGTGGGGADIPPTFDTVKLVLTGTQPPCGASDCHGGTHAELVVLAIDDQLYTRMTTYVSVECGNIPLVTPGNPEQSALVKILQGPCDDGVGMPIPRMPNGCMQDEFGNTCVPDEYIAAIRQWVLNGAPQ